MSLYMSKNFLFSEIACPCCGKCKPIDPKLTFLLQSLREKIGKPIYISKGGGIRCKSYNKKIGGYIYSPHIDGKAVDIHVRGYNIVDLAIIAKEIGFTRIGLYPFNHFIHVDTVRPYKSNSWVRDKKRIYHYFKDFEKACRFAEELIRFSP